MPIEFKTLTSPKTAHNSAFAIWRRKNLSHLLFFNLAVYLYPGGSKSISATSQMRERCTPLDRPFMKFEEAIKPLTELLLSNNFSVDINRHNLIEYSSKSTIIRVGYSHLEYLINIFVGQSTDALIELTPKVVEEFFNDDTFKFQSTLTVENLISFLTSSGKYLLSGDTKILTELDEYSLQASKNYTLQIINRQNIDQADKAWTQKDYVNFVKYIDQIQMDLLPPSYLKKYKIAVDKINK